MGVGTKRKHTDLLHSHVNVYVLEKGTKGATRRSFRI
jgi:hypothetical protein